MPFTVSASPAPLTFTIWPRLKIQVIATVADVAILVWLFIYKRAFIDWSGRALILFAGISWLFAVVRRERIEVYPDELRWETCWLGVPLRKSAQLSEVYGVEWQEGPEQREQRGPSYIEFYTGSRTVKAGYTLSFEEYEQFREQVRMMYPELEKRWGRSVVRSKDLTLLNLS